MCKGVKEFNHRGLALTSLQPFKGIQSPWFGSTFSKVDRKIKKE
jgi:hypothetical protein